MPITFGVASIAAVHPDGAEINVRMRLQATGVLTQAEQGRLLVGAFAGDQ